MFPQRSKILRSPIGWEDLGEVGKIHKLENGVERVYWEVHKYCNTKARIGKENGELFKFCTRCLIRTK